MEEIPQSPKADEGEEEVPQAPRGGTALDAPGEESWGDRLLVQGRPLSPRHRKLCELAAQGLSNKQIKEQLGYKSDSQVCIVLSNTQVKQEIERIRERIYEDTVASRLKKMSEPALSLLETCLTDRSNKFKENLKIETAKWIIEKIDGKAVQKHDIGDNILGIMMDRLDALKAAGRQVGEVGDIEVKALPASVAEREVGGREDAPQKPKGEDELLEEWVTNFT